MLVVAWILGCTDPTAEPDPVYVAEVVRAPVPPPEWLVGPLAFRADGAGAGRAKHLLCTDAPGVRAQLIEALGRDPEAVGASGVLNGACPDPAWDDWVRHQLDVLSDDPFGGADVLWTALLWSDDPEVAASVVAEAPDPVVLQYVHDHRGPYHPRLASVVARSLRGDDPYQARFAVAALARVDAPEVEAELVVLHGHAPPERRRDVALALRNPVSDAARRLYAEVCDVDTACDWSPRDPLAALPELLESEEDGDRILARFPQHRSAAVDAIARCASEDGRLARRCARVLASVDRSRAVPFLVRPEVADLLRAVVAGPRGLARALEEAGFPGVPPAPTAVAALVAAGHAAPIRNSGRWPPMDDHLAYELAALAGARDLAFDQVLPSPSAPIVDGRTPAIALHAYAGDWRYRILASPDILDPAAVVGLLNAVFAHTGHPIRLALDLERQHAIAGTPDALRALAAGGWVRFAPPPEVGPAP